MYYNKKSMAYVKQTFKYMFKAFGALSLACLPAAIVLGLFSQPMASLSYFVSYAETYVTGFKHMLWLIFSQSVVKRIYPLFLIFASLIFSCSLCLSVIEKHFRVGRLMLVSPLKQINNYFLPVLATLSILALILTLYGLVQTGVLTLLHFIVSGRGYPNLLNLILAAALSLGLFVLAIFLACSAMYWTPMMVIYGFSFHDAATASLRLIDHKTGGILCGILTPFLLVAVLQSIVSFIPSMIIQRILAVVLYLFLLMFVAAFIMVSLFALSGMERRDVKGFGGGNRGGF